MNLGEKQELFAELYPLLILKAHSLGFKVRLGDVFRDERLHGTFGKKVGYGHRKSCHKLKLAGDLNLFKDGKFLTKTSDHKELGEWWEKLHPLCTWGGRFNSKNGKPGNDGNHYSLTHWGAM